MLRINDVGAYLGVSHQRATQMYAERETPQACKARQHRASVEPSRDRAMGRAGVVGNAALEEATPTVGHGARQHDHAEPRAVTPADVVPFTAIHAYAQWVGLFQSEATVEPAADGRGVTIRAPLRVIVVFVVILGPILIGGGVLNQIFHEPDRPRLPVSVAAVSGVILVVLLGVVFTILQRGRFVRVGDQGLEVSDGLRMVKLAWSDISNVSLQPREDKLHINLTSGDERTCEVRFITAGGNEGVIQVLRRALATYLPPDRIEV